jgi:hypothetical protein
LKDFTPDVLFTSGTLSNLHQDALAIFTAPAAAETFVQGDLFAGVAGRWRIQWWNEAFSGK